MTAGAGEVSRVRRAARVRRRNSGCRREAIFRSTVGGALTEGRSAMTRGRSRVYIKPSTKATDSVSAGMPSTGHCSR